MDDEVFETRLQVAELEANTLITNTLPISKKEAEGYTFSFTERFRNKRNQELIKREKYYETI